MSFESVVGFLLDNIYYILALIGAFIGFLIGYAIIHSRLNAFQQKKNKYLTEDVKKLFSFTVRAIYGIVALAVIMTIISRIGDLSDNDLVARALSSINSLLIIVVIVLVGRIMLIVLRDIVNRVKGQKKGVFADLPPSMVVIIHLIMRYLIIMICGLLILLVVLSEVGLYDRIATGVADFTNTNSNYLSLIVVLAVLAFAVRKFIGILVKDMGSRTTRFSPQMMETGGKMLILLVYFILGLIVIFTLLSMAGMAEIGQTILLLMVTLVGVVVAMVATGSIGNILSGLILQAMKPFKDGQRVEVADGILGDVESQSLVFTRIRTLSHETIEIPNNLVLASRIVNLSESEKIGVEIDMGIGYDIPVDLVERLAEMGASMTEGVLKNPSPALLAIEFGDYAIVYRLRAFTDKPKALPSFRHRLIRNIQETFYENGVEILSPMYAVRRAEQPPQRQDVKVRFAEYIKFKDDMRAGVDDDKVGAAMSMFDAPGE